MTLLSNTPQNPNLLHANKFQVNFSRNPNVQFFAQSVMIPGISISEVPKPSPFVELYSPGDKAIYDILNITFLIDEDLGAWKEAHDWIRAMCFPNEFEEYVQLQTLARPSVKTNFFQFSDAAITILSSNNQPLYTFKFIDIFPIAISPIPLSSTSSPDDVLTADVTYRYSYYQIEKLF